MRATLDPSVASPERSVIVYDGRCGFCRQQIERIRERDDGEAFDYVSSDAEGLLETFPRLRGEDLDDGMRLLTPDGELYAGADAVHRIATRLAGLRHLAWLYRVPFVRGAARKAYAWVARNRLSLSRTCSKDGACRIDGAPEEAASSAGRRPRRLRSVLGALALPALAVVGHRGVVSEPSIVARTELGPAEVRTIPISEESRYVHLRGHVGADESVRVEPVHHYDAPPERLELEGPAFFSLEGYIEGLRVEAGPGGARLELTGRTYTEHRRNAIGGLVYSAALFLALAPFLRALLSVGSRMRARRDAARAGRYRPLVGLGVLTGLVGLAAAGGWRSLERLAGGELAPPDPLQLMLVSTGVLWAAAALVLGLARWEGRPVAGTRTRIEPTRSAFLLGLLGIAGGLAVGVLANALFQRSAPIAVSDYLLPSRELFPVMMLVVISAGVCEELVYRGYLQSRLEQLTGSRVVAVLVPSILFALTHLPQGWVCVGMLAGFGLVLGALTAWRRNLVPAIWAHCAIGTLSAVPFLELAT